MSTFSSLSRAVGLVAMLGGVTAAQSENVEPSKPGAVGFVDKAITVGGREHRYVVYVPKAYSREQRWPLLLFLNGMGECGTDGQRQVAVGLGPAIRKAPDRWPFVVVFPQKPDRGSEWLDHDTMVMAMLAATEQEYSIDSKRRFLTGLSQGGAGTWALGAKHADVFAAIAPVCGYSFKKPEDLATKLKATPIWAFHGENDNTVPVDQSRGLVDAVQAARGDALLTTYPGVGHNSWDKAYRDEVLPEWLLALPADRLGVWYLADAERVEGFKVKFRSEQAVNGARGVVTTVLELDRAGSWRLQRIHDDTAVLGLSPTPREGQLERAEARAFFAERLQELRDAQRPTAPRVEKGNLTAVDNPCDVELRGVAGLWSGQRGAGGSFANFLRTMSELR